jgi:hypothetical protein
VSTFANTAYDNLHELLNELQIKLGRTQEAMDPYARIDRASEFRGQLWDAIAAYRDAYAK